MNSLKILVVALGLMFTFSVASSYACDKTKTSAKSECSADMKKACAAKGDMSKCCTADKKVSADSKSECSATGKSVSAKAECCSAKKNTKLEAKNDVKTDVKTGEVKPVKN